MPTHAGYIECTGTYNTDVQTQRLIPDSRTNGIKIVDRRVRSLCVYTHGRNYGLGQLGQRARANGPRIYVRHTSINI